MKKRDVQVTESDGQVRVIGYVEGDTFVSLRNEARHLYRGGEKTLMGAKTQGTAAWGIDELALQGMLEIGIKVCEIHSDKATYRVPLKLFVDEGYVLHFKPHRVQRFLPLSRFAVEVRR